MAVEFDGSYAKLDCAEHHLAELEREIAAWVEQQPTKVSEFYPEASVVVARLVILIPLAWGVMTGNVIHNARPALDCGNQFPIFDRGPNGNFDARVRTSMLVRRRSFGSGGDRGTPPFVTSDYPDLPRDLLSDLSGLSNVDKHQRLVGSVPNPVPGHRLEKASGEAQHEPQ